MKHTPETFAALLNGREYPFEFSAAEQLDAKRFGLVMVCGASDDLCEFYGAFRDEVGCYGGGFVRFDARGLLPCPDDDETETLVKYGVWEAACKQGATLEAIWCGETPDERECSWWYKADFPHATFDIMEDGELYCQGIVFRLEDALKGGG